MMAGSFGKNTDTIGKEDYIMMLFPFVKDEYGLDVNDFETLDVRTAIIVSSRMTEE